MTPSPDTDAEPVPCLTEVFVPSDAALTLLDRDRIAAVIIMENMLVRNCHEYGGVAGLREVSNMLARMRQQVTAGLDEHVVARVSKLLQHELTIRQFPALESFEDDVDDWQDSYLS